MGSQQYSPEALASWLHVDAEKSDFMPGYQGTSRSGDVWLQMRSYARYTEGQHDWGEGEAFCLVFQYSHDSHSQNVCGNRKETIPFRFTIDNLNRWHPGTWGYLNYVRTFSRVVSMLTSWNLICQSYVIFSPVNEKISVKKVGSLGALLVYMVFFFAISSWEKW